MGPFRAKVYHNEQRETERKQAIDCKNCKQPGHTMPSCQEPQRCFDCGLQSHKRGDPSCLHINVAMQCQDVGTERKQAIDCKICKQPGHTMSSCQEPQRCFDCGLQGHKRGDPSCLHIESSSEKDDQVFHPPDATNKRSTASNDAGTSADPSPSPTQVIDQFFTQYVTREDQTASEQENANTSSTSVNVAMTTETEPGTTWAEECVTPDPEHFKHTRGPIDRFLRKTRSTTTTNKKNTQKKRQTSSQKRPRDSPPAAMLEPSRKQQRNGPPLLEHGSGGAT
ncbi:PREDICTED: uncharacterized protein LOC109464193 [Branchiostoma belcheri]|uniref:Uncharacterized protein LOC109464193 n=1 Tax=Branchiostoma belcheri TaxID=7741 RepID=A0A6P4YD70_BRABE|nr:PREDICTED: uncharacterized protein LOC109464193 [Branchiostoma belcheri]